MNRFRKFLFVQVIWVTIISFLLLLLFQKPTHAECKDNCSKNLKSSNNQFEQNNIDDESDVFLSNTYAAIDNLNF